MALAVPKTQPPLWEACFWNYEQNGKGDDNGNGNTTDDNGNTTDDNGNTTDDNGNTTDDNGNTTDGSGENTTDNPPPQTSTEDGGGNDTTDSATSIGHSLATLLLLFAVLIL